MHFSNLLLPLLTLSVAAPAASAARVNVAHGGAARRAPAHRQADYEKIRREGTVAMEAREGYTPKQERSNVAARNKGKRLVRKKKRGSSCQVHHNATSIASSSTAAATESVTSSIGNEQNWANATGIATGTVTSTAGSSTESVTSTSSSAPASTPSSSSTWSLVETWAGNTFFDHVNFWEWNDPTHGTVDFQGASDAWNSGLISINDKGHAIMAVDTTQQVQGGRKAIRVHGNRVFTGGLVIMDAFHMPTGCGTWPAWWQNGPNWPNGGEIDILEGVNAFSQNQVSLHTGPGCTIPQNSNYNQLATLTTGGYDSYDCSSAHTSNQGCGARDEKTDNSYGVGFNNIKGGVYAMRWSKVGITVWWFPRSNIPADITNDAPEPSGWGTPVAHFASDSCDPYQFFYDHYNIFDTTFCGDWAGADAVWNYAGYAGQDQSCAAITGYSTCSDYVLNQGSAFTEAYWEVASVKYFNSTTEV
ncbi:hypothetical protein CI109_102410 [Kwoniella shandongensis]|uniref:Uncharacterized protein n=1 Tax=Kwoniella shandongensis TaxID=1734106 RepID=A0A5M6C0Y6_9TREE|nr:uncharacterized protein CI109_003271 [Kwoniella shandongensis]KAA5528371.1 hypothetical protein CI109_003271 [Kwoniella shandongensis]